MSDILLGVNVDHVATLRQARGTDYPDPVHAAALAKEAGADSITVHLREDRRHIQDHDVAGVADTVALPLNFECAVTEEMVDFACQVKPDYVCFVPEKREELTTEGGLDVVQHLDKITQATQQLQAIGIKVSLFIDPEITQIEVAVKSTASMIEIHTGRYADALDPLQQQQELKSIQSAAEFAHAKGLQVNAGHGLHYENVHAIARIPQIKELNIGHSIVSDAVFHGFKEAVARMKQRMNEARQ